MKQFDKLEEIFNVAEKITKIDIDQYTEKKNNIIEVHDKQDGTKVDLNSMQFNEIKEDFINAKNILAESLQIGKELLSIIKSQLAITEEESLNGELISAISSLIKTLTSNIKTVTESYHTLVKIQKLIDGDTGNKTIKGDVNVINVNTSGISTLDLIKQFKD